MLVEQEEFSENYACVTEKMSVLQTWAGGIFFFCRKTMITKAKERLVHVDYKLDDSVVEKLTSAEDKMVG